MAAAIKTHHIFLGSYAKNYQILLLWEGNGCHFESELPGTLLQSEAYSESFYLLNTEEPMEPLTLQEKTRKSRFLQYTHLLKQKSNIVIESEFAGILGGFTQNPKPSTDFREVTKSQWYPLNPRKTTKPHIYNDMRM